MKKTKKQREMKPVDVHNDAEMVSLGLRLPAYPGRDESVWSKTAKEKALLKKMKHSCTNKLDRSWGAPPKSIPIPGKLIVRIRPSDNFIMVTKGGKILKKTTYSHKCIQSDIPRTTGICSPHNRIRTCNLWIRSPLLIPLSYAGKSWRGAI